MLRGKIPASLDSPELRALAEAIKRFKIPRQPFEDLILGLEMDLTGAHYETFEELSLYCYRVASTIGLICIEIFGYQNPRTRDYAVNLGTALQLVNILRDIQRDAQRGRIYIPQEDLDRFGVRPAELLAGAYNDPFIELMQFECDRARHYFRPGTPDASARRSAIDESRGNHGGDLLGHPEAHPETLLQRLRKAGARPAAREALDGAHGLSRSGVAEMNFGFSILDFGFEAHRLIDESDLERAP